MSDHKLKELERTIIQALDETRALEVRLARQLDRVRSLIPAPDRHEISSEWRAFLHSIGSGIDTPKPTPVFCYPPDACATHGRCWAHSYWVDEPEQVSVTPREMEGTRVWRAVVTNPADSKITITFDRDVHVRLRTRDQGTFTLMRPGMSEPQLDASMFQTFGRQISEGSSPDFDLLPAGQAFRVESQGIETFDIQTRPAAWIALLAGCSTAVIE